MKRFVSIVGFLFLAFIANAQNSAIDKLFDKYAGKDGFTTVTISKQMFELFNRVETNSKEDKDFKDVASKLTSIRI